MCCRQLSSHHSKTQHILPVKTLATHGTYIISICSIHKMPSQGKCQTINIKQSKQRIPRKNKNRSEDKTCSLFSILFSFVLHQVSRFICPIIYIKTKINYLQVNNISSKNCRWFFLMFSQRNSWKRERETKVHHFESCIPSRRKGICLYIAAFSSSVTLLRCAVSIFWLDMLIDWGLITVVWTGDIIHFIQSPLRLTLSPCKAKGDF